MPIYTYKCQDCGEEFDLLVGVVAEKEKLKCKKCDSDNLKRIFSAFGVGRSTSTSGPACSGPT
jgi:putative FmdB family regulatory protein